MDQVSKNGNGHLPLKAGKKNHQGEGGGKPTLYKEEYCQGMIDFFTVPTYRMVVVKRTTKALREGFEAPEVIEEFEERGGDLPFLSQYAHKIGVATKTLAKWAERHEKFGEAYNVCKELQKNHLVQNGVQGNYNPAFGIFTAKNITDMRDQPTTVINNESHVHHTSIKIENLNEPDLVDLLTGRANGTLGKPA